MNVNDVINLVNAGFTKEEIIKMTSAEKVPTPEPVKAEHAPEVKKEPAPEVKKEESAPDDKISDAVSKALKPFEELYNNMAKLAGMPSISDIQPKGIDDIIDNFFKGE